MHLRVEYRLGPEQRFLANLDTMHLMERALRRADLPYALSAGFNPHIRLSMGTVLPVGLWGEREYFDLELNQEMELKDFAVRLNDALPPSVRVDQVVEVTSHTPSLMKVVNAASYSLVLGISLLQLDALAQEFMDRPSLWVKSRGKKKDLDKDLRSGIYKVETKEQYQGSILTIWVAIGEPLNVRYDELLAALAVSGLEQNSLLDIYRSGNFIYQDTVFTSPLEKVK
ncbi:MAG TPA: TIGR03936 family radical SAM-associated protein [Syntrophomonadaceae bacterium]|nr:TIGR03936 family radical SAM-associated protein [Syntrophomonadaceae bacterium]